MKNKYSKPKYGIWIKPIIGIGYDKDITSFGVMKIIIEKYYFLCFCLTKNKHTL
jgi:hypothetical protein